MPLRRLLSGGKPTSRRDGRARSLVDDVEAEFARRGPTIETWGGGVSVTFEPATEIDVWDDVAKLDAGERLLAEPPEVLRDVVLEVASRARTQRAFPWSPHARILTALARRKLPFTENDARELLRYARDARGATRAELLKTALHAVELAGGGALTRELRAALKSLDDLGDEVLSSDVSRLRARILALLPDHDAFTIHADDNWATRVRPLLIQRHRNAGPVLRHFAAATQSKPTNKWSRAAEELLEGRDGLVRDLLDAAADAEEDVNRRIGGLRAEFPQYLAEPNAVLVKGAAWAAGVLDADWATPLLVRIFRKAFERNDALANACLLVLGQLSDERAVRELGVLQATVKHRGYQKRIVAALEAAASSAGLSPAQLLERLVPDFGLDGGRKEVPVGRWHARISATPTGAALTWGDGEKEQKTVPAGVKERHPDELKAVKAEVAELRKALSHERARIESLFAEEIRWDYADWRAYYLDHPLVTVFAQTLVWSFDGAASLGRDAPDAAEHVALWHPIRSDASEVAAWRERLVSEEISQPVKQAYREVYLLAPAEEETRIYSNRFAGHVLRYPQAYALFKERGWSGNALGPWDGGYEATIRREFRAHDLRAEFYLEAVEADGDGTLADLATTDQVRFYPLGGRDPDPVPLADVPKLVFSEAMRDVDLFVGVASIAADPTWLDRGEERYNDYWVEHAFGELTASAQSRRDVLAELLPKLKIADRSSLDERHLVVRGKLGTYRIHLGSGNVMMDPDRYVCIVPAPGSTRSTRGKVFLPFEEDGRLTVILSKAFLLADDDKIKDPAIARQLRA